MADPRGAEIANSSAVLGKSGRPGVHAPGGGDRRGDPERARVLLETGLARHADYASAHVVHGRVLLDLGLEAEAEAAFRRVLGLDPENLVALRALGDLARRAGRAAEALGYYEQLLLRDPSSEELEAIIGELRETAAPQPAEAGDPGQADEGQPDAGGDAGAAEGAEPGIGAAAGVVEAAYGAEEPAGPEAEEPAALGPQEPAGSGTEEPAALEPQEPPAPEAEQPVAPEPAAAVEGWADEGAAASHVEPAAFAVGSEVAGVAEAAPSAEVEAPVADEAGPEDADRLVASAEMDEQGARGGRGRSRGACCRVRAGAARGRGRGGRRRSGGDRDVARAAAGGCRGVPSGGECGGARRGRWRRWRRRPRSRRDVRRPGRCVRGRCRARRRERGRAAEIPLDEELQLEDQLARGPPGRDAFAAVRGRVHGS